jgi:hypothetical protein
MLARRPTGDPTKLGEKWTHGDVHSRTSGTLHQGKVLKVDFVKNRDRFSGQSMCESADGNGRLGVARKLLKILVPASRFELLTPRV